MADLIGNLSPAEAWLPFEPTPQAPFNRRLAAHLYRRAGFGASSRDLDAAVQVGPQAAVDKLFAAASGSQTFDEQTRKVAQTALAANSAELLAGWWLHRMRHTPAPLLEKATLFWHGHFATSAEKVNEPELLWQQNELLRRHALGDFGALVRGIARDPAMLLYLDSATNRKTHPNENFAREVMELFCLGIGKYSERDIQELARCFTGWEIQHGQFKFNQYQHDEGRKTVLGRSGRFDGDEGLGIVLDQPATAEFICGKLVRYFVMDEPSLPPEYLRPLAERFRSAGLMTEPVLKTILQSRLFYSSASIGCKIRSPVELGVGLLRSLEATANVRELATALRSLGQMPLYPPNVKGWNGGRAWIDSSTLLGRANVMRKLIENEEVRFGGDSLDNYLGRYGFATSGQLVDWLSEVLLAVPLTDEVRDQLVARIDRAAESQAARLKGALHLLGSLPEFQLA